MVMYPEDWGSTSLGDVSRIRTGSRNHNEKSVSGKYPFFVRSATVERIGSYSYDTEAVLVPGEGNIGRIFHYIRGKFDVHQRVYVISEFPDDVSGQFVFWYMKYKFGDHALQNTSKATVDSLRLPVFRSFPLRLPQLKEQHAIAEVLSGFDENLANLDELIAKKKAIRDGAVSDLVSGRKRLDGFSGDWPIRKVGELLSILHGKSQHGVEDPAGVYPILGTGGIIGRANTYLCNWPCVVIGRKGTIDRPMYIDKPFWSIDTLYYSRPALTSDPKFQYFLFNTIDWQSYTESSGRPSLAKDVIENIEVTVPSTQVEQRAIAEVLSEMDEEIRLLEEERVKVERVKLGAMDDLLTGRVRLPIEKEAA